VTRSAIPAALLGERNGDGWFGTDPGAASSTAETSAAPSSEWFGAERSGVPEPIAGPPETAAVPGALAAPVDAAATPAATRADGASATRAIKNNIRGSLILQVLNMVSGVELARGLGVTNRGALAAAMLWPTVIGTIGALGLEESMTYHVAREHEDVGKWLGSALVLCAIQTVVFTTITAIAVPLALHNHNATTIHSGWIFTGFVACSVFALALNGTLNGLHRYSSYNLARMSIGFAMVGGQTIFLIIGKFSVEVLVSLFMGCYVVCLLFDCWLVTRAKPGRLRVEWATVKRIFAFGIRSNTSTTSSYLNQRLDQLVISAFLTARQLGIYVVAVTFTMLTPLIGGSVAVATLPNIARIKDDPKERKLMARRLVSLTLLASILASLPIIIFAPLLIKIFFGSHFAVGGNITRVTSVASISFATTRSLEAVLRGIGRPLSAGMAEFVALGGTVVCLAALLPTLGLIGAAYASLVAYTTSGAWMTWRIKKLLGVKVREILMPDREGVRMLIMQVLKILALIRARVFASAARA
jgi:O-antigen/teichoic acid export membrane protein